MELLGLLTTDKWLRRQDLNLRDKAINSAFLGFALKFFAGLQNQNKVFLSCFSHNRLVLLFGHLELCIVVFHDLVQYEIVYSLACAL
jgi:hypothetical protein